MDKKTYATYSWSEGDTEFPLAEGNSIEKNKYKFRSLYEPLVNLATELVKDKSQKPTGNVYVATTCKIPRDKIKAYFTENNLTKTTRTYLAETVLIDLESIDKVFKAFNSRGWGSWQNGYMVSSEDVLKHNKFFTDPTGARGNDWYANYRKTHSEVFEGEHDVFIRTSFKDEVKDNPYILSVFPEAKPVSILGYPTGDLIKTLETLTFLKNNPTVKVVFDTTLNEGMTNEGIEMDDEIEKQVTQMLRSTDINDTKMAIEICSNFDLEKSLFRIAFMFNKHKNRFLGKQSMLTKTSYKQIDTYIRSKGINWMGDRDTFLSDMYVLYKEDEKVAPIIKRHVQDYLQSQLRRTKIKLTDIGLA
jgi:hypothetical protein